MMPEPYLHNILKYNTVRISATESEPPGCPDFARYTSSIMSSLTFLAFCLNSAITFSSKVTHTFLFLFSISFYRFISILVKSIIKKEPKIFHYYKFQENLKLLDY